MLPEDHVARTGAGSTNGIAGGAGRDLDAGNAARTGPFPRATVPVGSVPTKLPSIRLPDVPPTTQIDSKRRIPRNDISCRWQRAADRVIGSIADPNTACVAEICRSRCIGTNEVSRHEVAISTVEKVNSIALVPQDHV